MYEQIVRLKLKSIDGKFRLTDTLDTEGIFRLIESVPSPKAKVFFIKQLQIYYKIKKGKINAKKYDRKS